MFFIPGHFTSILQPLDRWIFANFKNSLKKDFILHYSAYQNLGTEKLKRVNLFHKIDLLFLLSPFEITESFLKCFREFDQQEIQNDGDQIAHQIQGEHPKEEIQIEVQKKSQEMEIEFK